MSSTAQVLANRQNATHYTGPQTPQGKETSSHNAIRHGLTGSATVLAHESLEDFEELSAGIREEYEPEGDNETFLVAQMIQARWKLLRIERLEAQAFEMILTEPGAAADPDARIVTALCASGNAIEKLQRYAAAAERSFYKALHELQSSRLRNQRTQAKMLDNYIQQVIYAPTPGERQAQEAAALRNEPNSKAAGAGNPASRR